VPACARTEQTQSISLGTYLSATHRSAGNIRRGPTVPYRQRSLRVEVATCATALHRPQPAEQTPIDGTATWETTDDGAYRADTSSSAQIGAPRQIRHDFAWGVATSLENVKAPLRFGRRPLHHRM
jgi:hypothetical protein